MFVLYLQTPKTYAININKNRLNYLVLNINQIYTKILDLIYTPSDRSGNIMPIKIEPGQTKLVGLGVKCALYEIGIGPYNKKCLYPKPYYLYARSSISKQGINCGEFRQQYR